MPERTPAGLRTKPKRPTLSLGEAPQFIFGAPADSDRVEVDLLPIDGDARSLHQELELVTNKTARITVGTAVAAGASRFADAIHEFISVTTGREAPVHLVESQEFAPFYDRYGLDTSTPPAADAVNVADGWLSDALRALDEIRNGFEVDGQAPTAVALTGAEGLLRSLAGSVASEPGVVADPFAAIGVEFIGPGGDRVLFVVEGDGSSSYVEVIGEDSAQGHFSNWIAMMDAIGLRGLTRAGIA